MANLPTYPIALAVTKRVKLAETISKRLRSALSLWGDALRASGLLARPTG